MKKTIFTLLALTFNGSSLAVTNFCENPTMSWDSDCTSTCSAIAAANSFSLDSGLYAACMGRATVKTLTIRKVELGRTEIGNESRCSIWEGEAELDEVSATMVIKQGPSQPRLDSCTPGVEYDALYFTLGRYDTLAGQTDFPDRSGSIVRTTSAYSAQDSSHTDTLNMSTWRDIGNNDTSKPYMIPNTGSPAWIIKKLAASPSNTNLSSSTNATIVWDRLKAGYSTYTNSTARPGFMCYENPDGSNLDTNDCIVDNGDDTYTTIMPSGYVDGLPQTFSSSDKLIDFKYTALKTDRGNNQYHGVRFLWYMDGADLKYVGVQPAEANGVYTQITLSGVRPEDGL